MSGTAPDARGGDRPHHRLMIKRLLIAATLLAALGGTSRAQADQPVTETVLGAGAIAGPFSFYISPTADVVVAKAVVQPGGNVGWHYERGAVAAVVQSGTLTLYD